MDRHEGDPGASRQCDFVLLVGDGSSLRRAARDLLDTLGLPVLVAESGREAMHLLETGFGPRVLLLDVELSTFDDLWEFRQIQLAHPRLGGIPAIVLSEELSAVSVRGQFRDVEVVRKPIRPGALLDALRRCLQPVALARPAPEEQERRA